MYYTNTMKFEELVGKTVVSIRGGEGDDEITFTTDTGAQYKLYHGRDCCETVYVESIVGDMMDLLGSPIVNAEEVTSDKNPADAKPETVQYQDSFTWTFYKLATAKGYVDIRWYGESNGYYSEHVDFCIV